MKKIAYLTIDDAPSRDIRRKVNYLKSKSIPAIFFCQGNLLEKRMDDAVYAIKKGFVIGNHSYSHPHFAKLNRHQAFQQIKKTDELIDKAYGMAGVERPGKLFRFPYLERGGRKKERFQKILGDFGYSQPKFERISYKWYKRKKLDGYVDVDCTYDTMDWATTEKTPPYGIKGLKEVLARMDEDVPEGCRGLNYSGSNEIILMHDFEETKGIFIPMIEKLITKNLKFELPKMRMKKEVFEIKNVPRKDLTKLYKLQRRYTGGPSFGAVKKKYEENPRLFVGCYRNKKLIGIVTGQLRRDFILLSSAAVNALYWRKGIGSKVLKLFDERAKEVGKKTGKNRISVCSGADSSDKYYMNNGYKPVQLLVWIHKKDVPKNYKKKEYEIIEEKNRRSNKVLYLKMCRYDLKIKEIVKRELGAYKVLYIFEKKIQ